MINSFELLNVPESAGDEEIRAAYLAKVREFPPERFPKEFQAVREAYDRVKTEKARIAYLYFDTREIDADLVCGLLLASQGPGRPSEAQFRQMLADSLHRFESSGP
ncbi:MAG: J domain-containing protein [Gammaproteobacteria bacterium]